METLGIMQPYFLPYIGYFQHISQCDHFVILDDVNFIKKGWINRNYVLANNESILFSLPVSKMSQNRKITDHNYSLDDSWKKKFITMIEQSYNKAPEFIHVMKIIQEIISYSNTNVAQFNTNALKLVCEYLDINTPTSFSSSYKINNSKGEERILKICKKLGCKKYINPIGGKELYNASVFAQEKIDLYFTSMDTSDPKLEKIENPSLSILHFLMTVDKTQLKEIINNSFKLEHAL